jgi:hypothetical protein
MKPLLSLLLLAFLTACAGGNASPSGTATSQAVRAQAMATQMYNNLFRTQVAELTHATATAEAAGREATRQAEQNLSFLATARGWPALLNDDFSADNGAWPVGSESDDLASSTWILSGGIYRWEAQAADNFVWWTYFESDPLTDFYLAADLRLVEGPPDSETGLIFRHTGENDYYLAEIDGQGDFSVYSHLNGEWESLLPWTAVAGLDPSQTNRLAVLAEGTQFLFFINDSYLGSLSDDRLASGLTGFAIGLSNPGDKGAWEFDNYELRLKD